jgi:hypothetical protein
MPVQLNLEEIELILKNLHQMEVTVAKMQKMKKYIIKHKGDYDEMDRLLLRIEKLRDKLNIERAYLKAGGDWLL